MTTFAIPFLALLSTALPTADEPVEHPLAFAVGTWMTHGTQAWGDGSVVLHRGIVESRLSEDGRTLERSFWAAFANGHSLGGKSVHVFDPEAGTTFGSWTPTLGRWDAAPAAGRPEGEGFVEVGRGRDGTGRFTSTTHFHDVGPDAYSVSTDLLYDDGALSRRNWVIHFERVPEVAPGAQAVEEDGALAFLLGDWWAEGTALLPDGSTATHVSRVDARVEGDAYVREFWGAMSTGSALRGRAVHAAREDGSGWSATWAALGGSPGPTSEAHFEDGELIEVHEDGQGRRVVTRYFDISSRGYRVQTDVLEADGGGTEAVWTAHFRRLSATHQSPARR